MKKAIAMRCTQEQFEAIKPRLKGLKMDTDIYLNEYLTNYLDGNENVISDIPKKNIGNFDREVYEEWNEQIFLEACGIVPTSKDILKHYKDAVLIKFCNTSFRFSGDIYFSNGMWFDKDTDYSLWTPGKGYQEILESFPTRDEIISHFASAQTVNIYGCESNMENFNKDSLYLDKAESAWMLIHKVNHRHRLVLFDKKAGFAKITSYQRIDVKTIITSKLSELEKRVEVLENQLALKKIADMPENPYKDIWSRFPSMTIPIPEYKKGAKSNGCITVNVKDSNQKESIMLPNGGKMHLNGFNFGIDFGKAETKFSEIKIDTVPKFIYDLLYKDFKKIETENASLKLGIEFVKAENEVILAGGKSKWEKEIEELKKENQRLKNISDAKIAKALSKAIDKMFLKINPEEMK